MALQANPIVIKELRARMRGGRPYLILSSYLLGLSLICFGVLRIFAAQAQNGMMIVSAHVGQGLFTALALALTLLITFLTPALTAGAISGEREQMTYDLLVATPLRPGRILSGKLIAALWYVLLLMFAVVPLGSIVLLFGGVAPRDLLKALIMLLLTMLASGMLGLLCSAVARRTMRATIMAYLIIMALIGGAYFYLILRAATQQAGPTVSSHVIAVSPFSAMTSIVLRNSSQPVLFDKRVALGGIGMGGGMPFDANMLLNMEPFNALSYGLIDYGKDMGPTVLPIYRYAYVGYPLFSIVCYWLASHFVRPRRRWRIAWLDVFMLLLLTAVFAAGSYWLNIWPWR
jgi:ABC-type transport system involved in multi-copper enzyme maturation permease subunit